MASTVGRFQIVWDGKDEKGHDVSNGIYLYRMEAGLYRQTRKLTVLR
jgi:flagellar hook assembly protein FlgD